MTDWRRGGCGGLRRGVDERLNIGDGGRVDRALEVLRGVLQHGGGLHRRRRRRRRLLGASLGGAWDTAADLVGNGARLIENPGWRRRIRSISSLDRKNGNGFKMCESALGDASAAVKRYMVRIMQQYSDDASTSIPLAVISVF